MSETHESAHHIMPIQLYLKVFGALIGLTVVTVLVSYAGLGAYAIPVAMVVAVIKASLVVGFFMHLKYDVRFNSLIFFSTLIFVVLFFAFVLMDVLTRGDLNPELDTFSWAEEQAIINPPEIVEGVIEAAPEAAPEGETQH